MNRSKDDGGSFLYYGFVASVIREIEYVFYIGWV